MSHILKAASLLLALCVAGAATGQSIQVPGPSLTAGSTITVGVQSPSQAGQKVTVTVSNGSQTNPKSEEVTVQLDANGNGSGPWAVPDASHWYFATFKLTGANSVARPIVEVPDPDDTTGPVEHETAPPVAIGDR